MTDKSHFSDAHKCYWFDYIDKNYHIKITDEPLILTEKKTESYFAKPKWLEWIIAKGKRK